MARTATTLGLIVAVLIALAVLGGVGALFLFPSPDPSLTGADPATAPRPDDRRPDPRETGTDPAGGGTADTTAVRSNPDDVAGAGTHAVTGTVLAPDGRPVAGALVAAEGDHPLQPGQGPFDRLRSFLSTERPAPIASTRTGSDGRFTLRGLGAGRWALVARADGWAPAHEDGVVTADGGTARPVELRLEPAARLELRVVDATEQPVADVAVGVVTDGAFGELSPGRTHAATTDADGRVAFERLPPGRATAFVKTESLVSVHRRIELPTPSPVILQLGGDAALTVLVRDGAGRPVAGAEVQAFVDNRSGGGLLQGTTGEDGTFTWTGLVAGRVPMIHAGRSDVGIAATGGFSGRSRNMLELKSGETTLHEMTLTPGAVVSGTVRLEPGGTPVPNARVHVLSAALVLMNPLHATTTDANGAFRFEQVPVGRAALVASGPGAVSPAAIAGNPFRPLMSPRGEAPGVVDVPERGELVVDLSVEVPASIAGRVVSAEDAPVPGAEVGLDTGSAGFAGFLGVDPFGILPDAVLTDADGRFRLEGVPPGEELRLTVRARGYRDGNPDPVTVASGGRVEDLVVRLALGAALTGRVTGPDGAAMPGVLVKCVLHPEGETAPDFARQPWRFRRAASTTTDAGGLYTLAGLPGGRAFVQVEAPGAVTTIVEGPVIGEGAPGTLDIELEGGRSISGEVRDAAGRPLANARVYCRLEADDTRAPGSGDDTRTDPEGRFSLDGLVAGSFTVGVQADGHPPLEREGVTSGDRAVVLTLEPSEVIAGRVIDPNGAPVEGVSLALRTVPGRQLRGTRTDADGRFTLDSIGPGEYTLVIRAGRDWAGMVLEHIAAGRRDLTIALQPGLSISGTVVDESGALVTDARGFVQVQDPSGTRVDARAVFDRNSGTFTVGGLAEGVYQVVVQVFGDPRRTGRAKVAAGSTDVVITVR